MRVIRKQYLANSDIVQEWGGFMLRCHQEAINYIKRIPYHVPISIFFIEATFTHQNGLPLLQRHRFQYSLCGLSLRSSLIPVVNHIEPYQAAAEDTLLADVFARRYVDEFWLLEKQRLNRSSVNDLQLVIK